MSAPTHQVTIVGAGLAGTLLAVLLARRGLQVGLYERRPDMRSSTIDGGRPDHTTTADARRRDGGRSDHTTTADARNNEGGRSDHTTTADARRRDGGRSDHTTTADARRRDGGRSDHTTTADARRRDGGRSINLALSARGITALQRAGLDQLVLDSAIPMHGRRIHDVDGSLSFQPYGLEGQHINSVSRAGLNMTLLDAAEASGVALHFEHRCTHVEHLEDRRATRASALFATADGTQRRVESDVLIGADGAFSAVRLAMMMTTGFDYAQSYLSHGYKELTMPPAEDGAFRLEPNALHIWPRHRYMLIALPNLDRSFTCTLFLPHEGAPSFDSLDSPAAVEAFFHATFPDAVPHLPHLTDDFFGNPTGALVTMRCHPFHRGRCLLVGDAAHAVVPFYGQGMNAAFEDCRMVDELYAQSGGDWAQVLERFTAERKRHADAIADLALGNFQEMQSHVADETFLRRKALEKELHRLAPQTFLPLYSMVSFSNIPYDDARRRAARQDELLAELLPAIMAGELELETVAARLRDELGPLSEV